MRSVALEALYLSRVGDSEGAIALLRAARDNGPLDDAATSLLFTLLGDRADDINDDDERIALCEHALTMTLRPMARSTWHLRHAVLLQQRGDTDAALVGLQAVLKLNVSDDHTSQARAALVTLAALRRPKKAKRP